MQGFKARSNVWARFGSIVFGEVDALDIGEYADPTQCELQYYVFSHAARQDVVRFQSRVDAGHLPGRLAELKLTHAGAAYCVEAVCTGKQALPAESFEYVFEAQLPPHITALACERHGVDDLAAALLLDALSDVDGPGRR